VGSGGKKAIRENHGDEQAASPAGGIGWNSGYQGGHFAGGRQLQVPRCARDDTGREGCI